MAELGHIEVSTTFPWYGLQFWIGLYWTATPTIRIDDDDRECEWGSSTFDVAPGLHRVEIATCFPAFGRLGKACASIEVAAGRTKHITYRPWLVYGRIRERELLPTARVARLPWPR